MACWVKRLSSFHCCHGLSIMWCRDLTDTVTEMLLKKNRYSLKKLHDSKASGMCVQLSPLTFLDLKYSSIMTKR